MKGEDVRFGSKADIGAYGRYVRFTPKSGHFQRLPRCPLSAISGHAPSARHVTNVPRSNFLTVVFPLAAREPRALRCA
jgi:hypothetical protein